MRALVRFETPVTTKKSTISCLPAMSSHGSISDAQVAMPEVAIGIELGRGALPGDASALDDRVPVGEAHQPLDVLVDDEDRLSSLPQALEALPDFLAHERREAFGRLIQDQKMRIGDERPPDRQHLLFAAGELVAHVVGARLEIWKQLEHSSRCPRLGAL